MSTGKTTKGKNKRYYDISENLKWYVDASYAMEWLSDEFKDLKVKENKNKISLKSN